MLLTRWGPGVGGRLFGSLLCLNSGPSLAKIWSTIRVVSVSDPSPSESRAWFDPRRGRPCPTSWFSIASKEWATHIRSSIHRIPVAATWTRNSWLSRPFRNWSATISSLSIGSSNGLAISASFCSASTYVGISSLLCRLQVLNCALYAAVKSRGWKRRVNSVFSSVQSRGGRGDRQMYANATPLKCA